MRIEVEERTSQETVSASTQSSPFEAVVAYGQAALFAGLIVFGVECVDRLAVLSQNFNGPLEPLAYCAYLAPSAFLGTGVGLACGASLLVGHLLTGAVARLSNRIPGRYRLVAVFAISIVVLALALRATSAAFPAMFEEPLLGVIKKINGRIVPIPWVVRNYSLLLVLAAFGIATVVVGANRVLSATRGRTERMALGALGVVAAIAFLIAYVIDSRVFFGRYELTMHIPLMCVALMLAFLTAACALGALGDRRRRHARFVVGAFVVSSIMSGFALTTLGANENLKALLWRRSIVARRFYDVVAVVADRDRDGFASLWNGSDADGRNSSINPFAIDVPGNGIDENGIGGDADAPVANPGVASAPAPIARNFVFIAIDTLRADRMSAYGYGRPTSPRIAEWARRGRFFERAYSQGSNTGISFASMQRSATGQRVFDKSRPTLFGTLERLGFVTAQINARRNDVWLETKRWRKYRRVIVDGLQNIDHTTGEPLWHGDAVTTRAIEYLSALPRDSRHATWIHYLDTHEPREKMAPFDFGNSDSDKYDTEVAFADREVGRLLDFLESSGALKDTVVVLMADHGESFGEHGMDLHGDRPYDEQIRVPLVVWAPGVEPARVSTPVAILDVAPTVLSCLGLAGIPDAEGISLLDDPSARPIFSETPINLQDVNFHAYAVTDGDWRYIYDLRGGTSELYNLAEDPLEQHNRADFEPDRTRALHQLLGKWLDRVGAVRPPRASDDNSAE